ncbi:hypothetical protein B0T22DRAFT_515937 [Podospora appendiculata]|uniref:HNH nuclease domain-containing protein n=1 Tax=Podospora appendiculata TaxID=314037 RepID=A0AAE1CEC9_9PEZI|nr:hypothetical protein B0T22DRAFT_515937 [Podospora appendiculata]
MDAAITRVDPSQASPLHRHQSSLEGIISFPSETPLSAYQLAAAKRQFYHIVQHFASQCPVDKGRSRGAQYSRPLLVRFTYEYSRSQESQDVFLRGFFRSMKLLLDEPDVDLSDEQVEGDLRAALFEFADYLLDNFFLPLKASTRKTPQPSPAYHSAIQRAQGAALPQNLVGTPERVSALRGACLVRDGHRCVVSRKFDLREALKRTEAHGDDARDDDGALLSEDINPIDTLEVAHILPHSLTKGGSGTQLEPSREAALAILNMFDMGVAHLIEGAEIDRPRNAMTLTHFLHQLFGDFRIFFEPTIDQPPHTYTIGSFLPRHIMRDPSLPVTRTLHLVENRTIDPPSPRLLAVPYAIAHILHLSAAGEYIDRILRDAEEYGVRADGSTELGRLVGLGLGQWAGGIPSREI